MADGPEADPEFTWEDLATATLPVLACFLGGATEKWAEGIIVALLGLLLAVNPPRFNLGWAFHLVLLGLVACAACAFLPADWFYFPAWREAMVNDLGLNLPRTVSPQPWLTSGCFLSFLAGLCWVYYITGQEVETRAARRQLRIFSVAVIVLASLSVTLYLMRSGLPFWHNPRSFGPFPNRNQTANLFGLTSIIIIACGHDSIRRGKKSWLFWIAGLGVVFAALVLNYSRAGIALLVVGSALWLAVLLLRSGSGAKIAVGISVLLGLLTTLLLFGGKTFERFNLHGTGSVLSADLRWGIFRDTFDLLRETPWVGLGLGNFPAVFPIFRNVSASQLAVLHPESDWLWVGAEMGWVGVALILIGAGLLAWRVFPFVEGTNQWFRLAAFIAALLFALHSVIDVGGHRVGTAYAGIFLFAMSLRRPLRQPAHPWFMHLFRTFGVLLFAIGITWIVATYRAMPLPGGIGVDVERHLASNANVGRQFKDTIEHASKGLEWAPLDWQLYFLRGLGQVGAKAPPLDALSDFRRARFLESTSLQVPYQEGLAWLPTQPLLAATAWNEALRRAGPERPSLFGRMLAEASQINPVVKQMLAELAGAQRDLGLAFMDRTGGAEFKATLERLLARDPGLTTLTRDEQAQLFSSWAQRGDREQFTAFLETHPEFLSVGWRGLAKQKAAKSDFRGASELVFRFGIRPALPQAAPGSIDQLQKALFGDPGNFQLAYAVYDHQTREGKTEDALLTLRRAAEQPGAPAYFHFLEAEAWFKRQNWERAWQAWQEYEGENPK